MATSAYGSKILEVSRNHRGDRKLGGATNLKAYSASDVLPPSSPTSKRLRLSKIVLPAGSYVFKHV